MLLASLAPFQVDGLHTWLLLPQALIIRSIFRQVTSFSFQRDGGIKLKVLQDQLQSTSGLILLQILITISGERARRIT